MNVETTTASLRLRSGKEVVLEAQNAADVSAGLRNGGPRVIWRGKGGNISRTDTVPQDQPNRHNYAATVPLWRGSTTAKTESGSTPRASASTTRRRSRSPLLLGSRASGAALKSLLSALDALGLVRDASTP